MELLPGAKFGKLGFKALKRSGINLQFFSKGKGIVNLSRSQQKHIDKLNNIIKNHLKESDFSGALRDIKGNPVPKPNGGFFDHLGEMRNSLTGLKRVKTGLEGSLKNPNIDSAIRVFLENSLSTTNHYIQRINSLGIK